MKITKLIIPIIATLLLISCKEKYMLCNASKAYPNTIYIRSNKHLSMEDIKKIDFLQENCDTTIKLKENDFIEAITFYDYKDSTNSVKIIGYSFFRPPFRSFMPDADECSLYFKFVVYINHKKYILNRDDKDYNKRVFNTIINTLNNKKQEIVLNKYQHNLIINNYCISYSYETPFWH